ncbi:hypothetical protein C8T65DRAFT_622841, partial [Cerioporus squamosus]
MRWVKGHAGDEGNEAADLLAKAGATKVRASALPPAPTEFLRRGASLRWITQRLAYKGIRLDKCKGDREATVRTTEQVRAALYHTTKTMPTVPSLWKSIRDKTVPRRMRDFWWKAMHDALRVGHYWTKIPGYEQRAQCQVCDCEDSLEHILLECDAPGQSVVWTCVDRLLQAAGAPPIERSVGVVLGAPALSLAELTPRRAAGKQRLVRILYMEAAHLVWKLRCERVIQHEGDPERWLHERVIQARWLAALNRRLRIDQGLTAVRLGKRALPRELVLETWDAILMDRDSLPEDWIGRPGVLVGMP